MKTHALKKRLDTKYSVSREIDFQTKREKLCIGSAYCHDFISLFTDDLSFRFAMDTFSEGEKYILKREGEISAAYLKLKDMVTSGEIKEYLEGNDNGKIPVYYEEYGNIIETHCTEIGWPNTTNDGTLMYNNTHFSDPVRCAEYFYGDEESREWVLNDMQGRVQQKKDELKKAENRLAEEIERFARLKRFLEGGRR